MRAPFVCWLARGCVGLLLCLGLVSWNAGTAVADPIDPGFDLFSTPPFMLDLGPLGMANMVGDPIGPGNTDTIVERKGPGPGEGQTGTIDIEIVALSLQSVAPVMVNLGEGPQAYDLHIGLDPANPSLGRMTITEHNATGGTFDSFFDVFTVLEFTPLSPSAQTVQIPRQDPLQSQGSPWSHTRPPHYPLDPQYPHGGFFPGVTIHTGPHPRTDPSMPEPGSLVLLAIAGVGLGLVGRHRKA